MISQFQLFRFIYLVLKKTLLYVVKIYLCYKRQSLKTEAEGLKKELGINYFTQDLWTKFCNNFIQLSYFNIPELEIKGFTQTAASQILRILWRFNEKTQNLINEKISKLSISSPYTGFHIRGGDKIIEANIVNGDEYIQKAIKNKAYKNAFILTDDYRIFESISSKYHDWNFTTLCKSNERGYIHEEYMKLNKEEKFSKLLNLISSVEILSKANHFYGTYTSNPGMFLGMKMGKNRMTGLDKNNWITRW